MKINRLLFIVVAMLAMFGVCALPGTPMVQSDNTNPEDRVRFNRQTATTPPTNPRRTRVGLAILNGLLCVMGMSISSGGTPGCTTVSDNQNITDAGMNENFGTLNIIAGTGHNLNTR